MKQGLEREAGGPGRNDADFRIRKAQVCACIESLPPSSNSWYICISLFVVRLGPGICGAWPWWITKCQISSGNHDLKKITLFFGERGGGEAGGSYATFSEFRILIPIQYNTLSRRFRDLMAEYNQVQEEYREKCKERIQRQLKYSGFSNLGSIYYISVVLISRSSFPSATLSLMLGSNTMTLEWHWYVLECN